MTIALLILIPLLLSALCFVLTPLIRKITNSWICWAAIGIIILAYVISFRFYDDWKNFDTTNNISISKALLLDICPFCAFALPLAMVLDPTRNVAKVIAPFAIFGGWITILTIGITPGINANLSVEFIFLGADPNPLYYMMHVINACLGLFVVLSAPRNTYINWIYMHAFAIFYYSYVAIMMLSFNLYSNVSGLNIYDWEVGEYSGVRDILSSSASVACAVGFIASILAITIITFGLSKLQKLKYLHYPNKLNIKSRKFILVSFIDEKTTSIWETIKYKPNRQNINLYMIKYLSPVAIWSLVLMAIGLGIRFTNQNQAWKTLISVGTSFLFILIVLFAVIFGIKYIRRKHKQ